MAELNWIATELALQPAALTVQAQRLPPNDPDELWWDQFFTSDDVPSVDLSTLQTIDYRPTADRRAWNAPGRRIPLKTPDTAKVSMVPIEANFAIDEYELQKLGETAQGNAAILREQVMAAIPRRIDMIAQACWRRLEVDAFNAWANGEIVQRNPENAAQTFTMSFGFGAAHYLTAGTAWDNGAVDAYDLLQAWITAAEDVIGPIQGAMTTLNVFNAILADAPNLENSVTMTRTRLEERISDDRGRPFTLVINERKVDVFEDGGTTHNRTRVWPAGKIAAIPEGGTVGSVSFAPTLRAWDVASEAGPNVAINRNRVIVYPEVHNSGKRVEFQAQLNALPIPEKGLTYVTATGVA